MTSPSRKTPGSSSAIPCRSTRTEPFALTSLAAIQGARCRFIPFTTDWQLPDPWPLPEAHLTFLPNPNSPSGTLVSSARLEWLAGELRGALVIDEAYVDFAQAHALHLGRRPNVIVTRSLSKSHALAGMRFGYAVADPALVHELIKVKDSYNVNCLSMIAANAALQDLPWMTRNSGRIRRSRDKLSAALKRLDYLVYPSHANFVLARRPGKYLKPVYEELKRRKVLVRYFDAPGLRDCLRITVGAPKEVQALVAELAAIGEP